jgi:hypothetical protein
MPNHSLLHPVVVNLLPTKVAHLFLDRSDYFGAKISLLIASFTVPDIALWGHVTFFSLDSPSSGHSLTICLILYSYLIRANLVLFGQ